MTITLQQGGPVTEAADLGFAEDATVSINALTAGAYDVSWTAVSKNGHVVKGHFMFNVTPSPLTYCSRNTSARERTMISSSTPMPISERWLAEIRLMAAIPNLLACLSDLGQTAAPDEVRTRTRPMGGRI